MLEKNLVLLCLLFSSLCHRRSLNDLNSTSKPLCKLQSIPIFLCDFESVYCLSKVLEGWWLYVWVLSLPTDVGLMDFLRRFERETIHIVRKRHLQTNVGGFLGLQS